LLGSNCHERLCGERLDANGIVLRYDYFYGPGLCVESGSAGFDE
jgi:hypothetical protein